MVAFPSEVIIPLRGAPLIVALALASCTAMGMMASRADSAVTDGLPPIVPLPRFVTRGSGTLRLPASLAVEAHDASDASEEDVAASIVAHLRDRGVRARIGSAKSAITIRLSDHTADARLGREGYILDVSRSGVTISANAGAGLFYGLQTFEQLSRERPLRSVPFVHIVDWPQYGWRGIHLDVSRHFFPVTVVERYIDIAARYKLNTFHWHLTDDQGWRLQIPRYPRLTSVGGCRVGSQAGGEDSTATDHRRYCGSYTQNEVREVVAYAARRFVRVVPEIEMPGHSVEALAAYPWLACRPGTYRVRELWGVSTEVMCPTERTFRFIDDVVGDVVHLFPGAYVHVGGDEVPKGAWRKSPAVLQLRAREHLRSYEDVQAYFTRRVEALVKAHQRRIVAWDDVLSGRVSRSATIMAWHGTPAGVVAAKRGNDVVMTPDPPLYFDAYQAKAQREPLAFGGLTTLGMVYAYDPMPAGLSASQARHILGEQANLWTEYVATPRHLWYMLLPRELALAEACWTPRPRMNYADFTRRIVPELQRLSDEKVTCRKTLPLANNGLKK